MFEQKQSNPFVRGKKMVWEEETRALFETESTTLNREPPLGPRRASEEELSVKDFTPAGGRIEKPVKLESAAEEVTEEAEETPEQPFQLVDKVFEVEVTQDIEKTTPEGIPVKIAKGTRIKVAAPGYEFKETAGEEKQLEKEKKKKLDELGKDGDLGAVG